MRELRGAEMGWGGGGTRERLRGMSGFGLGRMMRGGLRVGRREGGIYKGREKRGGRREAGRKRAQGDI